MIPFNVTSCSSSVSVAKTKFLPLADLTETVPAVPSTSPAAPLVRPANLVSVSLSRTRKDPRTACCCFGFTLFEIKNGELFFNSTDVFFAVIMLILRTTPPAALVLTTAGDRGEAPPVVSCKYIL